MGQTEVEGNIICLAMHALKIYLDKVGNLSKGYLKMEGKGNMNLLQLVYRLFHCQKYKCFSLIFNTFPWVFMNLAL